MRKLIVLPLMLPLFISCGQEIGHKRSVTSNNETLPIKRLETGEIVDKNQAPTICPTTYQPVCGEVPCPVGAHCFVPPTPTTYANTCRLQSAGAVLLYAGACK